MARTTGHLSDSPHTADGGQHRPPRKQREPEAATVVLTPKGQRRLPARAAWLATGPIPRFAHHYLDDPDRDGWASAEYGHDVSELAFLTRILQRAITTDQPAPETRASSSSATKWQSSSPTATPSGSWWPARSRPHLRI
jgi:hypothetical protein